MTQTPTGSCERTGVLASQEPAQEPGDRRERRRAEQRDRMYRAAVGLFTERGYESTTMEDIAQAADVARASVFNHYQRKIAFIDEWSARRRAAAAAAVGDAHDLPTLRAMLERYVVVLAGLSTRSRAETAACFAAAVAHTDLLASSLLAEQILAYVQQPHGRAQVREGVRPHQVATIVATGYFAELRRWTQGVSAPFDLEDELLALLDLVLGGVLRG